MMNNYEVNITYSGGDACYVARILEFPGCAVDGPTPEAALANLRDAKDAWIEAMRNAGHPIPVPPAPKDKNHHEFLEFETGEP